MVFGKVREVYNQIHSKYAPLKDCPKELWLLYGVMFLDSYAYFSSSLSLTLFLSEEFGYTDAQAGWIYGLYGVLVSVYGFASGVFIDKYGVKITMLVGSIVCLLGRIGLTFANDKTSLLVVLFFVLPFGIALGSPVLTVGIKRATTDQTQTCAFALFYSIMNVAALACGPTTDTVRYSFADGVNIFGYHLTSIRIILFSGAVATVLMIIVALLYNENDARHMGDHKQSHRKRSVASIFREALTNNRFWKLFVVSLLLTGVRMVFRHLDGTFPKYLTREMGENALYGTIFSINPLFIIFSVPLVAAYTAHVPHMSMIINGSFLAGGSIFVLCIGAYYWTSIVFVLILSVGEAIYSPRVFDYMMLVSPKGEEGLYTSLASAPTFAAKLLVGGFSGYLLEEYCPETGPRNCEMMWFYIGLTSISSPILMYLFRSYLEVPSDPSNKNAEEKESLAQNSVYELGGSDSDDPDESGSIRMEAF